MTRILRYTFQSGKKAGPETCFVDDLPVVTDNSLRCNRFPVAAAFALCQRARIGSFASRQRRECREMTRAAAQPFREMRRPTVVGGGTEGSGLYFAILIMSKASSNISEDIVVTGPSSRTVS